MPVLDTVVLFAAADEGDRFHEAAKAVLSKADGSVEIASSALLEFDVVMKGRGVSSGGRMREFILLMRDYPALAKSVHGVSPSTFVLASGIEGRLGLDYFDSLVAAEGLELDGRVVSSDRDLDRVPGLVRIPLKAKR